MAGRSGRISIAGSRMSTHSNGITAQPIPARTIASWAPLSKVRKTNVGTAPAARSPSSMSCWQLLADERGAVELGRAVGAFGQVAALGDEHERVVEQNHAFEVGGGGSANGERHVELAADDLARAVQLVLVLEQADVDVRVLLPQSTHDRR